MSSPQGAEAQILFALSTSEAVPFHKSLQNLAAMSPLLAALFPCHHTAQEQVSHLACDGLGIGIHARVVPGVNPIHHAKQAQHSKARGKLQPALALQVVEQSHANPVILPLD